MKRGVRAAVVALALATAAAAAGPAHGAAGLQIGMEDERLLLDEADRAPEVVAAWAAAGVDLVRLHARWSRIAPGDHSRRRPAGFRPSDPDDPRYDWAALDRAVSTVTAAGLALQLTVTGPGPLWSSRAPRRGNPRHAPDPREFAAFARAVAKRYRGRVARYLIWNEPNIPGWLQPQFDCRGRSGRRVCRPASPHIYRGLFRASAAAIKAADPGTEVLFGELAPIGYRPRSTLTTMAPLTFLRALGCMNRRLRPLRSGRCAGFRPLRADAFGHHAHGVTSAPDRRSADRDWAKLGDLRRLERLLDALTRRGRLRAPGGRGGRFDIHLTEFGYQTSPPDHAAGIGVARQSAWLQQAGYIAWSDPRVQSLTHYQWEDEPVRYRGHGNYAYAGWQSGLLYVDGTPKPAMASFPAPLVVDRRPGRTQATLWGQIRPGGAHAVTIERASGASWTEVATLPTRPDGAFTRRLSLRAGDRLRFRWSEAAGSRSAAPVARVSGTVRVPSRRARLSAAR